MAEMFSYFVGHLAIGNAETICTRYGELTSALKKLEDMNFSDEEIDAFLPKELKRISKEGANV